MPPSSQPRLFVIVASDADVAAVFRRGPSDWYHVIKWNLEDDSLESGAWFRGRIYPEKCDISPDGKLLLCFVHQGRKGTSSYSDSWTAVSRVPWLTAIALWPSGTTYGGGGRFVSSTHVILRMSSASEAHREHPPCGLTYEFGSPALHASTNEVVGADWSGRDRNGRLIYALRSRLFRRNGNENDRLIADLTLMPPDPTQAPRWAAQPVYPRNGGRRTSNGSSSARESAATATRAARRRSTSR